jgi:putative membrane protein
MTETTLPVVNATLNGTAAVLLVCGFILIKRRQYVAHAWVMCSAFAVSIAFLTCYLIYHALFGERSSGLPPGPMKDFYLFVILLPHVLLAIIVVPMILRVLYLAYRRNWLRHPRLGRPTFWIWLYVSVSGVVVYWMLYHLFPRLTRG